MALGDVYSELGLPGEPSDLDKQIALARAVRDQPATMPSQGPTVPPASGASLWSVSGGGDNAQTSPLVSGLAVAPAPAPSSGDSLYSVTGFPGPGSAPAQAPVSASAPSSAAVSPRQSQTPSAPNSGGPVGNDDQLSPSDFLKRALAIQQQEAGIYQPFDPAPYQQMASDRAAQANRDFIGGLALSGLGGEAFSGAGAQVLKQALSEQAPMDVAGGMGQIVGGRFVPDQMKLQAARIADLQRQENFMAGIAATTSNEQLRREAQQQAADLRQATMEQTATYQKGELDLRRQQLQLERYKPFTDQFGRTGFIDAFTGQVANLGGMGGMGGPGGQMPDRLPLHATPEDAAQYGGARNTLQRAQTMTATINAHPEAFGPGAGVAETAGKIPFIGPSLEQGMNLSPEGQTARADVQSFGAQMIADLKRSATNPQVLRKLDSFAIDANDPPEKTVSKLRGLALIAQQQRGSLRQTYGMGDTPDPLQFDPNSLQYTPQRAAGPRFARQPTVSGQTGGAPKTVAWPG